MEIKFQDIKIEERLNSGRFGDVYTGQYAGKEVAIKIYHGRNKSLEYQFSGLLDHENEYRRSFMLWEKVPEIRKYVQEPIGVSYTPDGRGIFLSNLVKDHDNKTSQNLKDISYVDNLFIDRVRCVVDMVHSRGLYFFEFFPENILCQKYSEMVLSPVFIDLQSFNNLKSYPWLALTSSLGLDSKVKKDNRRLERLVENLFVINRKPINQNS